MKMGPQPYTASENMAADQGHHVLQYYINIIANAQQLLDMEGLFGTSAKLDSRNINFYCKKLTQVEVGYWLLNVA